MSYEQSEQTSALELVKVGGSVLYEFNRPFVNQANVNAILAILSNRIYEGHPVIAVTLCMLALVPDIV